MMEPVRTIYVFGLIHQEVSRHLKGLVAQEVSDEVDWHLGSVRSLGIFVLRPDIRRDQFDEDLCR